MENLGLFRQMEKLINKWATSGMMDARTSGAYLRVAKYSFLHNSLVTDEEDNLNFLSSLPSPPDSRVLANRTMEKAFPKVISVHYKAPRIKNILDRMEFRDRDGMNLPETHRYFLCLLCLIYLQDTALFYTVLASFKEKSTQRERDAGFRQVGFSPSVAKGYGDFLNFFEQVLNLSLDEYLMKPLPQAEVDYVYSIYAQLIRMRLV